MGAVARLSEEDRRFLSILSEVVYANPFSDQPPQIDALTADSAATSAKDRHEHYLHALVPVLEAKLDRLRQRGADRADAYRGGDRQLLEHASLFLVYLRWVERIDELIADQVGLGEKPARVPFASRILADVEACGFPALRAERYFGLFYQLRRGFYFIAHSLVGASHSMRELRRALWNSVFTHDVRVYERHLWNRMEDFSTLLLGETGTGKGAAAAAIGRSGFIAFNRDRGRFEPSFSESFVAINLSQFSESLIESELFGHRKGAFTGAVEDHTGVLGQCSPSGALFLDEIGEVSIPVQIKLLQVLQERTYRPVGSHERRRFEGRVIAATNRPMAKLRLGGGFREDFFYRLCSNVVTMPPLRQRIEEAPGELEQLVALLVERITGEPAPGLVDRVLDTFQRELPGRYSWPGNVRELEQAVRRVLLTGHYVGDETMPAGLDEQDLASALHDGALTAKDLLARYCALLYRRLGSYEEVARRIGLDRRTVKKHAVAGSRS